jgi:hypothetical protein
MKPDANRRLFQNLGPCYGFDPVGPIVKRGSTWMIPPLMIHTPMSHHGLKPNIPPWPYMKSTTMVTYKNPALIMHNEMSHEVNDVI